MDITIYTGDSNTLSKIDGCFVDGCKIIITKDGAGVPFVNIETINNPVFDFLKPYFEELKPIKYTPFDF
jgi:hypothetical protein